MTIKMIATDIDGTLVNDDKKITTRTLKALKAARDKGVYVVLCTGRPVSGIQNYLDELGLTGKNDYAITFNGAQAMNVGTNEIIFENDITYEEYVEFVKMSSNLNIKGQLVTSDSQLYVTDKDISKYSVIDAFYTNMPLHYRSLDEVDNKIKGTKFMWVDDPEKIAQASNHIPQEIKDNYYVVLSAPWFLEFTNPLATKGNAVLELAKTLNIKRDEIMTIGDENNDLTMLEEVDLSVAMGNGNQRVKEVATVITDDNNHDGLGKAVEKYVL